MSVSVAQGPGLTSEAAAGWLTITLEAVSAIEEAADVLSLAVVEEEAMEENEMWQRLQGAEMAILAVRMMKDISSGIYFSDGVQRRWSCRTVSKFFDAASLK